MTSSSSKRRKLQTAFEALDKARSELEDHEDSLKKREKALERATGSLDEERKKMASVTPSDVIYLNVGGHHVTALRRTLCQYEPSMLACQFSGRWDKTIAKDENGRFFIDQRYELFEYLLNYLRTKAVELPHTPFKDLNIPKISDSNKNEIPYNAAFVEDFERMVEYYGMTPFVYQTHFSVYQGKPETAHITNGAESTVSTTDWCTLRIRNFLHPRTVESFEIIVESFENIQVGWTHLSGAIKYDLTKVSSGVALASDSFTVVFDSIRGGIVKTGTLITSVAESITDGTVIQCSMVGFEISWCFDGSETTYKHKSQFGRSECMPIICGRGKWRLANIRFA